MPSSATSPSAYDRYLLQKTSIDKAKSSEGSEPPEDPAVVTKFAQIKEITEQRQKGGGPPLIYDTSSIQKAKGVDDKYQKYALVVRRNLDDDGAFLDIKLEINSYEIREYLLEILGDFPGLNLAALPIEINQPYEALFHNRQRIREDVDRIESETKRLHLQLLVEFIRKNLGEVEREHEKNVTNGRPPKVSFNGLWTIFPPGTTAVSQGSFVECLKVLHCEYKESRKESKFKILGWRWDYDNGLFGPSKAKFHIASFLGLQEITTLNACPLDNAIADRRTGITQAKIRERGRKWREIVEFSHQEHESIAWIEPRPNQPDGVRKVEDLIPSHISGRVIIDYKSHKENNWNLKTELLHNIVQRGTPQKPAAQTQGAIDRRRSELDGIMGVLGGLVCRNNDKSYVIDDELALLTPSRVRGFSLRLKVWAFFLVDALDPIQWHPVHFQQLKLELEVKDIILSLVKTHQASASTDMIAAKGSGLIILLHGPPGTGKTLTAESIAETTKRPLLSLSSGDLGIHPDIAEQRLRRHFDLAKLWKAIILLDEADVFLAKRRAGNIGRNAFVSIFLRHLEYYNGILFLTTNRVSECDPAFQSRVHFSIKYPALTEEQRTEIWGDVLEAYAKRKGLEGNLGLLPQWNKDVFKRLGRELKINGRDVNNLIRVAEVVADAKATPLSEELIRSVFRLNQKPVDKINEAENNEELEDEPDEFTDTLERSNDRGQDAGQQMRLNRLELDSIEHFRRDEARLRERNIEIFKASRKRT